MHSVATCNATHQLAVDIGKGYRQAVVLHLAAHLKLLSVQSTANRVVPVGHVLLVVCIGKRQHRILVCHLCKVLVKVAAHTQCWRVGIVHFGMTGLKVLKLVHKEVEILVGYIRLIKNIILVIMLMQRLSKI